MGVKRVKYMVKVLVSWPDDYLSRSKLVPI